MASFLVSQHKDARNAQHMVLGQDVELRVKNLGLKVMQSFCVIMLIKEALSHFLIKFPMML